MPDPFINVTASPILEEFKNHVVAAMTDFIAKHPETTNADIIATMGRATGYAIALCQPYERVEARELATKNMIEGIKAIARWKS